MSFTDTPFVPKEKTPSLPKLYYEIDMPDTGGPLFGCKSQVLFSCKEVQKYYANPTQDNIFNQIRK